MDSIITFLQKYWIYILGLGTFFAYILDKLYSFWIDKKKRQHSYNRIFTAVIKLYYSYLKHKNLYSEEQKFDIPIEAYAKITKYLDTFKGDLNNFKNSLLNESEIQPEISIQAHSLFELADRMTIMDNIKQSLGNENDELSEIDELIVKRAQFHSLEETFDDFFEEIINNLKKHTTVKKEYIDQLLRLKTEEYEVEVEEEQRSVMVKYFKSLHRQGALPKEVLEFIINQQSETNIK